MEKLTVKVLGTPIGGVSVNSGLEKKSMFDANQAVHDFYLVMSNAQEKSESPYTNNALRGGKMRRYLPDKVWGRLSPAQRAATNRKKIQGDKRGQQFVANTDTAKDKARSYRKRNKL